MAIKKNLKKQPEEELWTPVFSEELLFRIKNIVDQTGITPPNLFLKWVLQEETWIGLVRSGKGQTTTQSKTAADNPVKVKKEKGAKRAPLDHNSPEYRKTLVTRAKKLKKEGVTLKKIAETFNDEKMPTISGVGKWYASSINNLMNTKK